MTAATAPTQETRALTIVEQVEQSPVVTQLNARSAALLELLPDAAAAERFKRVSVQAIVKNPDLLECTPESVILSIFEAAAQGLEPTGAAGGAHLVPYRINAGTREKPHWEKRAQLIPDYRGVIRLVTKPGSDVQSIEARVVKEGDEFSYELGLHPIIRHVPSHASDASKKATTHVYAIARLRDGTVIPDVMDRAAVARIEERGGKKPGYSPWASDWDEMAKKTVIKRLAKVLPVRPEVRAILVREDELAGIRDDDQPAGAPASGGGTTRASQLASRLAKDVTPEPDADPSADQAADSTDQAADEAPARPETLTQAQLLAWLDEHGIDRGYAVEIAKAMPGRNPTAQLTGAERVTLVEELERLAADQDAGPWADQAVAGL